MTVTDERLQELIDMHLCYNDIMKGSNEVLKSEYADLLSVLEEAQASRIPDPRLKEAIEEISELMDFVPENSYDEGYYSAIVTATSILYKHILEEKDE